MNLWNKQDLKVMEFDDKMILLKEEFDKENGTHIKDYSRKLNSFLNRKLKKESDLILKRHFFLSLFFLTWQENHLMQTNK